MTASSAAAAAVSAAASTAASLAVPATGPADTTAPAATATTAPSASTVTSSDAPAVDAVVFDLGGVLVDWNPRYLYRKIFGTEAEVEEFLERVCTPAWNAEQDRGRPWAEAVRLLQGKFPHYAREIEAYHLRWSETLAGDLPESVAILSQLRQAPVRLLALTNWSAETFPVARERFPFLRWFEGIVVSGEEEMIKPDAEIFELLCRRYRVRPERAVFIDDSARNVQAAQALGFHGIHFTGTASLREGLRALGMQVG